MTEQSSSPKPLGEQIRDMYDDETIEQINDRGLIPPGLMWEDFTDALLQTFADAADTRPAVDLIGMMPTLLATAFAKLGSTREEGGGADSATWQPEDYGQLEAWRYYPGASEASKRTAFLEGWHAAAGGRRAPTSSAAPALEHGDELCGDERDPYGYGQALRCVEPRGHSGLHCDVSRSVRWGAADWSNTPADDARAAAQRRATQAADAWVRQESEGTRGMLQDVAWVYAAGYVDALFATGTTVTVEWGVRRTSRPFGTVIDPVATRSGALAHVRSLRNPQSLNHAPDAVAVSREVRYTDWTEEPRG